MTFSSRPIGKFGLSNMPRIKATKVSCTSSGPSTTSVNIASLLNPGETTDLAGYPAGFRFSPDSQWLVRMQKIGAGFQTLFLYRRNGFEFSAATPKPLSEMAWDYFWALPVSRKLHRNPKDRDSLSHVFAALVKGMDDNYAWLGLHWPDSRYVVISLSFDAQGEDKPLPYIEDWWCAYDLKTGTFSVPAAFAKHNAKAFTTPRPKRKYSGADRAVPAAP